MLSMSEMNDFERLMALFDIFGVFGGTKDFKILSSPSFTDQYHLNENEPMQKALKFILQNFHKPIFIKDMLEVTNMSASTFCSSFKTAYRMTFKDYLLNMRIGYACKLLTDSSQNISSVAYLSGFENISNFNRQFKKIKGITPSEFMEEVSSLDNTTE